MSGPMPLQIDEFLQQQDIKFNVIFHGASPIIGASKTNAPVIPGDQLIRVAVVRDSKQLVMVLYPAGHMLDYQRLCMGLGTKLALASEAEVKQILQPLCINFLPPFPKLLKLPIIIDSELLQKESLFIESNAQDRMLKISQEDFRKLLDHYSAHEISIPVSNIRQTPILLAEDDNPMLSARDFLTRRMHQRIHEMRELPIISDTARELLKLRTDPKATVHALAMIVLRDPVLSAQVIHWARSPYYGFSGQINTVEDAIIHVLGFDLVINLAIGLAISGDLKIPVEGAISLKTYWQSAVYTAAMVQELAKKSPMGMNSTKGTLYLSGLLHNFGLLVLGHLFVEQLQLFNFQVKLNQQIPVRHLQYQFFGVGYEQVGYWLFKHWHLPEEVLIASRWHNEENYQGVQEHCVHMMLLSSRLLKRIGVGFADSKALPMASMKKLGLTDTEVIVAFEKIILEKESLNEMSQQLVRP